ncbi:MAG: hypothetical protein HXK71_01235 [Clostridiales bacterium]|nr:hypothetical protein [Clostridiales bacterium]
MSKESMYYLKRFVISIAFICASLIVLNLGFEILQKVLQIGIVDLDDKPINAEANIYFAIAEIIIFAVVIVLFLTDIFTKVFGIGYRSESLDIRLKKKIGLKSLQRNLEGEEDDE